MINALRGSRLLTLAAGAGALTLLGLASCADVDLDDDDASDHHPSAASDARLGQLGPAGQAVGKAKAPPYTSSEIIVRFKSGIARTSAAAVNAKHGAQVVHEYRVPSNLQVVALPKGVTVDQAVEAYNRDPEVMYAEPNYIYELAVTPNDPSFGQLYGMNNTGQTGGTPDADINAPEAWEFNTGSNNVVIGLLDSGFDYNHPDLIANVFNNPGEIAGNGVDDDGNGVIDDLHGLDAIGNTGNPLDTNGHGTHVSGTMAARGNNGIGVAGVNWNATVVACRAFNPSGALDDILQCMDYFLTLKTRPNNPIDIVATNNSWGGGPFSQALQDAITAHGQAGMLFVAAAGNFSSNNDVSAFFPATYPNTNIISVLATTHNDQRASFSNFGASTVDIGAPGENIFSTLPNNTFGLLSGTSMATPHVTGLVGLLKAQNPSRTSQQIKNLILTGGTPTPGTTGNTMTGRRIRANNSLNCVDRTLVNRVLPAGTAIFTGTGTAIPLSLLSITCDSPTTAPQVVTVAETGQSITLVDNDGSGQFTGSFTPARAGTFTLTFPNGDVVSVTAVANYSPARVVPFEFPTINGTVLPLNCDDCSTQITSPFPIRFGGANPGSTSLFVGSNGLVSFTQAINTFTNQPLPSTVGQTIVAAHWDDLFPPSGGTIRFEAIGMAPNRQLVIEWRNIPHISVGGSAATFQIVFFENSPNIRYNYADVVFGNPAFDNGASATVGVQVTAGVAQQFSFNTAALSNNLSLLFTMGAPQANAGPDQVVLPNTLVTLDGTGSTDLDGEIVSFAWTQIAGQPVVLTGADTATPSFTAPDPSGTLTFRLDVADDEGNLGSDTVNVIVNRPPVAVPNPDFRIGTNLRGTLDARASTDPDGVIVGFQWTQVHGDPVVIQNAGTQLATFISPPTPQILIFQLTVTDEHGFSDSDLIAVDVFLNLVPVAAAGQDRIARPGSTVTLDGSGSRDPDGTIVAHSWTTTACFTVEGPCTITLEGADTATPSFLAPRAAGVVVLELTVTDNAGAISTDSITIGLFLQAPNPQIIAQTACVAGNSTQALDGSRSIDPDGTIVSYEWTQIAGPPVVLSGANSSVASYTTPAAGTLVFALTVTDDDGLFSTTQVTVPVDPPPVANAVASAQVVLSGATVTLDGSASIDAASFFWRQIAGTTAVISNGNSAVASFVAPRPAAPFEVDVFELLVTDACGFTSSDTVSVVVVRN
jgi:serine protease